MDRIVLMNDLRLVPLRPNTAAAPGPSGTSQPTGRVLAPVATGREGQRGLSGAAASAAQMRAPVAGVKRPAPDDENIIDLTGFD